MLEIRYGPLCGSKPSPLNGMFTSTATSGVPLVIFERS
jgi:hypothetical protein